MSNLGLGMINVNKLVVETWTNKYNKKKNTRPTSFSTTCLHLFSMLKEFFFSSYRIARPC